MEQLEIKNGKDINKIRTANQAKVILNETFLWKIAEKNKKIDKCFQMVAAQSTDQPTINNKMIVPPTSHQEREKHKCPAWKRMCFHKLLNLTETNAKKK